MQTQFLQEHELFLLGHVGDLLFQTGADRHNFSAFRSGDLLNLSQVGVAFDTLGELRFAHVGGIDDRLSGEQGNISKDLPLRIAFAFKATGRGAGFQIGLEPLEHIHFGLVLLVALECLYSPVDPAVENVDIREDQFVVDGFNIPLGVDGAVHMDDLAILKAAYHMDDGIHFPDMGEELVSKAFAIGSAPHQTCNVYKFDGGRGNLIRIIHFSQLV